ncbi:MAG: DNA internalization-related competence protein ComEC/Rec2 [Proteobacteria bacterium]|nr:DNA internalization-related competence protein ComEC/Rec2 [Pseudomonadota bacterium]
MLAGTLAFAIGIYCLLQFSFLPPLWVMAFLPLLFLQCRYFPAIRIIFIFYIGFCWALFCAVLETDHYLNPDIEKIDVFIKGTVVSLPEIYGDHIRFLMDINEIKDSNDRWFRSPGIVRLSWYRTQKTPSPGEIWQLKTRLKRPYGFMNPGGFDYEAWMLRQGIKAIGYVKQDKLNQKMGVAEYYFIQRLRYKIAHQLKHELDKPLLGLVLALSLGDRSQLERKQWEIFTQTGTNHLIAISGLHLGLIAGFIYFLARFFWSRFYFATQRIPAPYFASLMAFAGAFFYAVLAGFALPAQRSLIMISVCLFALFSAKQILIVNVICIAVILVLILDPFAIIAADFWLSFLAVIIILYVTRFRISKRNNLMRWIRLQCLLSIALCPILIFWFKQIPLYSLLANLIAIPVIGFLLVPLILVAMILLFPLPGLSQFLYNIIDRINEVQWSYLEFLSQQNYVIIPVAAPNLLSLALAVIGIIFLLMPRGLPARWLGIIWILPLLFPLTPTLNQGEFDFNLLDVGQGLSAVIQTNRHTLVYDTGAKFSERFNIGDAVLKPYLRYKGINQISLLLISHGDNDHIGGVNAIIENFKIDKILTSVPTQLPVGKSEFCHAGQKWGWDGVDFEILHPQQENSFTGNNGSCVLKVASPYGSVLLTGDIERQAEKSLLKNARELIKSDILLVPHHGSRTSSTKMFISAVAPKYAFTATGYRNRFGFPKQDIISRYETHGIETLVSYKTGEISAKFREGGLKIDEFRTNNRRFWHY